MKQKYITPAISIHSVCINSILTASIATSNSVGNGVQLSKENNSDWDD